MIFTTVEREEAESWLFHRIEVLSTNPLEARIETRRVAGVVELAEALAPLGDPFGTDEEIIGFGGDDALRRAMVADVPGAFLGAAEIGGLFSQRAGFWLRLAESGEWECFQGPNFEQPSEDYSLIGESAWSYLRSRGWDWGDDWDPWVQWSATDGDVKQKLREEWGSLDEIIEAVRTMNPELATRLMMCPDPSAA